MSTQRHVIVAIFTVRVGSLSTFLLGNWCDALSLGTIPLQQIGDYQSAHKPLGAHFKDSNHTENQPAESSLWVSVLDCFSHLLPANLALSSTSYHFTMLICFPQSRFQLRELSIVNRHDVLSNLGCLCRAMCSWVAQSPCHCRSVGPGVCIHWYDRLKYVFAS
ncbi:hypothetical protein R3P38DRAFT_2879938 [Favolaschia claudopus]|uniref:Secreted protein n=1 Tax=Favolaschia claudopus TaxID=2862362 RepID=A0AAW0CZX2_9AGAR